MSEEQSKSRVATIENVSGKTFDCIVVGAGNSGLTVASRLAEDPNVSVAVLEAGGEMHAHDAILLPAQFGRAHGDPELVYTYDTEVQPKLGRPFQWARGRGVGGSSAINFLLYQKPPRADIDAWEELGVSGWNWKRFEELVKRSETFHPPPPDDAEKFGYLYDRGSYGTEGPVQVSFGKISSAGEVALGKTFNNLGIQSAEDSANGEPRGFATYPNNIDPRTNTRSFSATGYFLDKYRPNLHLLTGASARKILLLGSSDSDEVVASGVEFVHGGETHSAYAKLEVILSAGALRSPALLELSGIGDKNILEPLGIPVRVNNPGVGENVQEHLVAGVTYEFKKDAPGIQTLDLLADPAFAAEQHRLHAEGKGLLLTQIKSVANVSLSDITSPERVAHIVSAAEARAKQVEADSTPGLKQHYDVMLKRLKDPEVVDAEILYFPGFPPVPGVFPEPGKMYGTLIGELSHPFSRGSIHIKSPDASVQASIQPNSLDHDYELDILLEQVKFMRKIGSTAPSKDLVEAEVMPGPAIKSDEELRNLLHATVGPMFHTVGTCAMSPREQGGVVDASLKVYGTKNLRVCDISIAPLHVAAHTQTLAYAIGEHLAEVLKAEYAA